MQIFLIILFSTLISFIIAPIIIGLLYKLKFRQQGKVEVDSQLEERKQSIGVPVMGGFILVISISILYFVCGIYRYLGYIPLIILVGGTFIGFLSDYLDLLGKIQRRDGYVYEKPNPLIYKNFLTWRIYMLFSWPFRVLGKPIDSVASYQTGIKPSFKFFLEIVFCTCISFFLYRIFPDTTLWLPFGKEIDLGVFIIPFNVFVMLAFANAYSWTDGIDAISPGNQGLSYFFAGILSLLIGNLSPSMSSVYYYISLLCFIVVGTELTFYYFNIPPARVEMSDVGTIPLGIIFAFVMIILDRTLLSPIIGFVFVVEILSSIIQTFSAKVFKKLVFKMAPIHHHFEKLGWSREKIVMRSYFISIISGLMAIVVSML